MTKKEEGRKKRRRRSAEDAARASFTVRMDKSLFDAMNELMAEFEGSRNDYIVELVRSDIAHQRRFKSLNTSVDHLIGGE